MNSETPQKKAPPVKSGVKSAAEFAEKFAGGKPLRFLAFRIQTALRSQSLRANPPNEEELAGRLGASIEDVQQALVILLDEGRASAREDRHTGRIRYYAPK